jgi:hypothetical protein
MKIQIYFFTLRGQPSTIFSLKSFPESYRIHFFIMKTIILIAFALYAKQSSFAQISAAKEPYWNVYTDAVAKKTTINFFDTDRNLLYQEVLSGKYIRLNRRNRNILDLVLLQVRQNSLVATNAKLETLQEPRKRTSFNVDTYVNNSWRYIAIILGQKMLQVNVQNPKREKISVKLYNPRGKTIFIWRVMYGKSKLYNLESLLSGKYKLVVSNGQTTYTEDILISNVQLQRVKVNSQTLNLKPVL